MSQKSFYHDNQDITIAMSSPRADPVLATRIKYSVLLGWLKDLNV